VPREKLNIEIVSEGSPGFLGIGSKKALIRASLLAIDRVLESPFTHTEVKPKTRRPQPHPVDAAAKTRDERIPERKARTCEAPPSEQPASSVQHEKRTAAAAPAGDGEPVMKKARRILEGLLQRMQIDSTVSVEETEEAIVLKVKGDGGGLLIGKRGQNLDAIQYVINKAVHRSLNGCKMIVIDTEDYRERREESLVVMARRLGEKVKKTKKPVTVGHMNAHDRRIIHLAIQNDASLTTKSRGEGEYRKILILPARKGSEGQTS
jgi:spoIIIJ-associated protein